MSRHYEFLQSEMAELVVGEDLLVFDEPLFSNDEANGTLVALVIGNPYDAAGVLYGTREEIAATLRQYLELVEPDETAKHVPAS
jgi:hypothetical protein